MSLNPIHHFVTKGAGRVPLEQLLVRNAQFGNLLRVGVPFCSMFTYEVALDRAFVHRPVIAESAVLGQSGCPVSTGLGDVLELWQSCGSLKKGVHGERTLLRSARRSLQRCVLRLGSLRMSIRVEHMCREDLRLQSLCRDSGPRPTGLGRHRNHGFRRGRQCFF